jgi:hypothetical protein
MQTLNFNTKKEESENLNAKNKELSKLLREQQLFLLEGNDYMAEKIGRVIERLTQSMNPIKEHENSEG